MIRGVNRAIVHRVDPSLFGVGELELVTKSIPDPLPGYVIVHILLRPVHPTDLPSPLLRFGHPATVPGSEGYGIVHAIGQGVTRVKPGQRVVPLMRELQKRGEGSWQEYVCVSEQLLMLVPDSVSDEIAAQAVLNPWTAVGLMTELNMMVPGDYLLQTAAGSVLGRMIIQLAKHKRVKTINVVRREEQKEELKALGADEVICSTTEDIVARVKEITNNKLVYAALDCIGGELTKSVTGAVRSGGTVLVYGVLSGSEATINIYDLLRGVIVRGWLVMSYWEDEVSRNYLMVETWKLLEAGIIQPLAGAKFELSEFRSALEAASRNARGGKVMLETKL